MVLVLIASMPISSIAVSDGSDNDTYPVIADVLTSLGVPFSDSTTISLTTISAGTASDSAASAGVASANSYTCSSNSSEEIDVLLVKSTDNKGNISATFVAAANDNNGEVMFQDIGVRRAAPSGYVTGSILSYNSSLDSSYDYYFALGTTYASASFSGKYAFRPSSVYCYLRAESTATHGVSRMLYAEGLSGDWVNSSGVPIEPNVAYHTFNNDQVITNPTMGTQYNMSLTNAWTNSGYGSNDYILVSSGLFRYVLTLEIEFDNGRYAYIEHTVYEV